MLRTQSPSIAAGLAMLLTACGWGGVDSAKLDLSIQAAYVTQGTQTRDGAVPLVEGRDGWVRVLVTADQPSNAWPDVRVTLFDAGAPVTTFLLPAAELVPFEADEGSMRRTWNVRLPGAEIAAGRSLLVELDPDRRYADRDPANDAWPAPGLPQPLDVRAAPPLEVVFVPLIVQGWSGGSVASSILPASLERVEASLRAVLPLGEIVTSVHTPVATSIDFWTETEPEMAALLAVDALWAAEQPADSPVHYVAILPWAEAVYVTAGGLGYVPGKTVAAWDYAFDAGEPLVPHELGHNFGLYHTPCAPSSYPILGVDPAWPGSPGYASAHLGVWGMDVVNGTPKDPAANHDLMSYCSPVWISDYSYVRALELREAAALPAPAPSPSARVPTLLLSGFVDGAGVARLEPPTLVDAPPPAPSAGPATHVVEARDAAGRLVAAASFEPRPVADAPPGARTFTVKMPLSSEAAARVEELRWIGGGRLLARRAGVRPTHAERDGRTGELRGLGR